jgi:hypothetical protein
MVLKLGSRGADVRFLQLQLRALGFDVGDIDGHFGPKTHGEVLAFQRETDSIDVDGIVGPETAEALKQALVMKEQDPFNDAQPAQPQAGGGVVGAMGAMGGMGQAGVTPCDEETWQQFMALKDTLTGVNAEPVKYGPGRGLFVGDRWVITKGPGRLNSVGWSSELGGHYASFHCSSFTNFFLGWLLRYDDDWTHAGNIPSLFEICEAPNIVFSKQGVGTYRGYGPFCRQIMSNGATKQRNKAARGLDIRELHDRRHTLPTFLVCGQSSKRQDGTWRLWHHTVLFAIDHNSDGRKMFRIAADGTKNKETKRWSGKAMRWTEVDEDWIARHNASTYYRPYGVLNDAEGAYNGKGPRPPVSLEG